MNECDAVSESGLPCQKKINPNLGFHGGGHMFASSEIWNIITNEHVNATALLSGLPASHHKAESCTDPICQLIHL